MRLYDLTAPLIFILPSSIRKIYPFKQYLIFSIVFQEREKHKFSTLPVIISLSGMDDIN